MKNEIFTHLESEIEKLKTNNLFIDDYNYGEERRYIEIYVKDEDFKQSIKALESIGVFYGTIPMIKIKKSSLNKLAGDIIIFGQEDDGKIWFNYDKNNNFINYFQAYFTGEVIEMLQKIQQSN